MSAVSEILEKYVAGLNSHDPDAIAELYADECDFVDGGARPQGFPDTVASGKEGVRETFKNVFSLYDVKAEIVNMYPNSMQYDVHLAGFDIPCIGAATLDENGLIKEYIVRPR